jgi:Tol biopolymer transport system component
MVLNADLLAGEVRIEAADAAAITQQVIMSPDGCRIAFDSRRDGQWNIYILRRSEQ